MKRALLTFWLSLLAMGMAAALAYAGTPKDTLIMASGIDDVTSFDPAEVYEFTNGEVDNNVYLRLVVRDENDFTKIVGGAAESWKVSEDGLTFTFKMRSGLVFASGAPVTAEDAAFSLQRVVKLAMSPSFILTQLGWSKEDVDQKVKALDAQTLQLQLSEPFAPTFVLNALSAGVGAVVEKAAAMEHEKDGDLGHNWLRTHSAGAGAFVLRDWRPNDIIVLEANDKFYLGKPGLKRIIIRHVPEATTERLMLEKGDIDIARQLGAEQLQAVSTNPDLKIDITDKSTVLYLGLNQGMKELANPKVRQAIRWLVKYDQIADTLLKRQYRAHESVLSKGSFAAVTDKPYHYDLAKAKALLAEAGYADGFKLELDVFAASPFREIAQALQSSLGEAGIKVSIIASDRRQTLTKYRARNHQAVLMVWSPDYGDPDSTMDFFLNNPDNSDASTAKTAAWRNKWFDPKLKELSDKAVLEHDGKKRTEMYTEIQHGLQTNSPFVVMFQQTEAAAMRKNVEHWLSGPSFDTYVYRGITK